MLNKTHLYFPINKCGNTSFKKIFVKYKHILISDLNISNNNKKNLNKIPINIFIFPVR